MAVVVAWLRVVGLSDVVFVVRFLLSFVVLSSSGGCWSLVGLVVIGLWEGALVGKSGFRMSICCAGSVVDRGRSGRRLTNLLTTMSVAETRGFWRFENEFVSPSSNGVDKKFEKILILFVTFRWFVRLIHCELVLTHHTKN